MSISAAMAAGACQRGFPESALAQLVDAQALAAELRVSFTKAAGASDRAVMADTDEASIAFAREAERSIEAIERTSRALETRLESLKYDDETRLLAEFSKRFTEYRTLDRDVLRLAVENTNLKAQRLSFGPVRETAAAFQDSVDAIARGAPLKDRCRAEGLAAQTALAVRQIQVLQAPHIAEASDPEMESLEKTMTGLLASARDGVTKLGDLAVAATRPALANAAAALDRFESLSGQLVALSRRNTNVRSLALALGPKPALTAACDASLLALVEALAKKGQSATR